MRHLHAILAAALLSATTGCATSWPAAPPPDPAAPPYVKTPQYWPEPVMDQVPPALPALTRPHRVLIFSKTNGFRDDPQIKAANAALARLVADKGWDGFVTENAAVFNPDQLGKFDLIVLNSISGNVFTEGQRAAFRGWLRHRHGLVALHGSGGDHDYDWQWYVHTLIGAQFIGHTARPKQFQQGTIHLADIGHPALRGLPAEWRREEEWYSFNRVPAGHGTHILAWLDENSYAPVPNQRMGPRHPIIWTRCVEGSRVFYSALGHKAETYSEPLHLKLISGALDWAISGRKFGC